MAQPTTAIQRFDASLSYREFSVLSNRAGFIGLQVLPPTGVRLQSAKFQKVKAASVLGPIEDTKRAPKGNYARDTYEWETDNYSTVDHGVEEVIDDRIIRMYGNEITAENIHIDRAINRVLMAFEDECAKAVFNTTTWTGAALTTAVGTAWTVVATSDPVDDIDKAKDKVRDSSGAKPNTLILTELALRAAKRSARIENLLKYSGRDDPKNLGDLAALQDLFGLDRILVADGWKNTAARGKAAVFGRLWDQTMAMVAHVNVDSIDLENPIPTVGSTIMWTEENATLPGGDDTEMTVIIEEYREEGRRGGIIRARADYEVKIIHPQAGHLLTGVTA